MKAVIIERLSNETLAQAATYKEGDTLHLTVCTIPFGEIAQILNDNGIDAIEVYGSMGLSQFVQSCTHKKIRTFTESYAWRPEDMLFVIHLLTLQKSLMTLAKYRTANQRRELLYLMIQASHDQEDDFITPITATQPLLKDMLPLLYR